MITDPCLAFKTSLESLGELSDKCGRKEDPSVHDPKGVFYAVRTIFKCINDHKVDLEDALARMPEKDRRDLSRKVVVLRKVAVLPKVQQCGENVTINGIPAEEVDIKGIRRVVQEVMFNASQIAQINSKSDTIDPRTRRLCAKEALSSQELCPKRLRAVRLLSESLSPAAIELLSREKLTLITQALPGVSETKRSRETLFRSILFTCSDAHLPVFQRHPRLAGAILCREDYVNLKQIVDYVDQSSDWWLPNPQNEEELDLFLRALSAGPVKHDLKHASKALVDCFSIFPNILNQVLAAQHARMDPLVSGAVRLYEEGKESQARIQALAIARASAVLRRVPLHTQRA